MPQKICTNYGKCVLANTHEDFSHEKRSMTYCPLCDKKLSEVVTPSRDIASKVVLAVSSVFILFVVFGFALDKKWVNAPAGANAAELKGTQTAILRLADSNTLQDSLGPALAEAFFKAQGATDVQTLSGADPQVEVVQGILPGDGAVSSIEIAAHSSEGAVTALADKNCDVVGITSQVVKSAETGKLASKGDLHPAASEHVLGLDGIAIIVNASNPISELRKDTIRRIFAGEITDWSRVGSTHGAIQIYARDDQSGIFDSFRSSVLGAMQLTPSARLFEDSNELSLAVSNDPNGIGFVSLPFVHSAKSVAVSDKGTDALKPTRLTVETEDYPLSRRLYLYTPASPQNAFTQRFVEFALSKDGQDVVAANGLVAQNVVATAQTISKSAPEEYKQLTQGAERLSLDLRFNAGDLEKDSMAQADLDRVVSLVADEGGTKNQILLFGFTDNAGASGENEAVSLNRAKVVEKEFIQRGIRPTIVKGFGSELPVASNDTAEGRAMNRRVEIWMRK
ncbi:MAG: phosphate ABC transporter substrate-binding/OmpA family protein [Terracidiphilus sp.]|jgi:phosphate transport system substrate-binding protein